MPPSTNLKSFIPLKADLNNASYDPVTHEFTFKDEFGFHFIIKVRDLLHVNARDWINDIPEYRIVFDFEPVSIKPTESSIDKEKMLDIIKNKDMIPESLIYDTMTIGFVYAPEDKVDPLNHTWMLEFWDADLNHRSVMHFLDVKVRNCDISTRFWKKGIYHGRFQLTKNDIKIIKEHEQNKVTIHGNGEKQDLRVHQDISILDKETKKLRFRYNVITNYWYADLLGKDDSSIAEPLKFRSLIGENVSFDGNIIWSQKPKVMMHMNTEDISSIKLMADTLVISGR